MSNCLIILNYNDSERVQNLIKQVEDYPMLHRILIVDNCSADNSYEELVGLKSNKIDVIKSKDNYGYAAGNNWGAQYALEKWNPQILFFANPDVAFEENAVKAMENALNQKKSYAVSSVLVRDGYNVWDLPDYWGTVRMLFLAAFSLHKAQIKRRIKKSGGIQEVGCVEGSFFAIKASAFKKVQGFDDRTFLYLEENILAHRLRSFGFKEVINADGIYVHEHSRSISKEYGSKAKAFKLFLPGFQIYLTYYLNCGKLGQTIFYVLYMIAYVERIALDVIKRICR